MAREVELQGVDVMVVDLLKKKIQKLKTKMVVALRSSKVHHGRLSSINHNGTKENLQSSGTKSRKVIKKDYKLSKKEVIGKGSFGSVRVCTGRKTGKRFACKTIHKSSTDTDQFVLLESDILKYLSGTHPGILNLKDFYEDPKSFHLVMELCTGGQLKQGKVTEDEAAIWIKEIMSALRFCHAMGVVHRDIKPQNILFTESGTIKWIDFGLATWVSRDEKLAVHERVGSPSYVAPEVIKSEYYSDKVDVWSAGVILYNLLSGTKPFHGNSLEAVGDSIISTTVNFDSECWKGVTPEARDLVGKMLHKDPSFRLTAGQVLNHPCITIHTNKNQNRMKDII